MSSSTSGCRWLYGVLGLLFVLAGALAPAGLVRAQQLEVGQPQPCEPSTEAWLQQRCGGNAHCRIVEEAIANGLCFLLESRVVADPPAGPTWWLYHDQESVGMTAMAVLALLNHLEGHPWDYAYVQGAIAYLLSKAHADGAIYSEVDHGGARHFVKTYETSLAAVALVAVWVAAREAGDPEPLGGEIERAILSARRYLLDVQNIEAQGRNLDPDDPTSYVEDSPHYGGWGYPSTNRSDLSNTQFAVWALRAIHMTRMNTGPRPHAFRFDSTFPEQRQVALLDWYVQRSQAGPGSGFRYQQGSGVTGMMTAAALWGLWCASAGRDDQRVLDGFDWLSDSFTVLETPGQGPRFKYMYLWSLAKAAVMFDVEEIGGVDWYRVMADHLMQVQQPDGSWPQAGDNLEPPIMATAEAVMALEVSRHHTRFWRHGWRAVLGSPATLHVFRGEGVDAQHTGPARGGGELAVAEGAPGAAIETGIPGSTYVHENPPDGHQTVEIAGPQSGTYRVEVRGTKRRPAWYTLTIEQLGQGGHLVTREVTWGKIAAGETHRYHSVLASFTGPLNVANDFPPSLSGVVRHTDSLLPGSGASVYLWGGGTNRGGLAAPTRDDGSYGLPVAAGPGSAVVTAWRQGYKPYTGQLPVADQATADFLLEPEGVLRVPGDFASIAEAVDVAAPGTLVQVAGRAGGRSLEYREQVRLREGVRLQGGYDAETWALAPEENPTRIVAPAQTEAVVQLASDTVLSGFALSGGRYGVAVPAGTVRAVVFETVMTGNAEAGFHCKESSDIVVAHSTSARNAAGAAGLLLEDCRGVVVANTVATMNLVGVAGANGQVGSEILLSRVALGGNERCEIQGFVGARIEGKLEIECGLRAPVAGSPEEGQDLRVALDSACVDGGRDVDLPMLLRVVGGKAPDIGHAEVCAGGLPCVRTAGEQEAEPGAEPGPARADDDRDDKRGSCAVAPTGGAAGAGWLTTGLLLALVLRRTP